MVYKIMTNDSWCVVYKADPGSVKGFNHFSQNVFINVEPEFISDARQGRSARHLLGFTGAGILHGKFVSSANDIQEVLSSTDHLSPVALCRSIRGSLSILTWNTHNDLIEILADPLGGAFVYSYRHNDFSIYASSIDTVVNTAESLGVTISKSLDYLVSVMVVGNGGFYPSSYEDVQVLPQFSLVEISDKDIVEICYRSFESQGDYLQDIELIYDDYISNVSASADFIRKFGIAHLTGGFDSRLILAALSAAGKTESFMYFCSGPDKSIDKSVHLNLCREFGLTSTDYPGFSSASSSLSHREIVLEKMRDSSGMMLSAASYGINNNQDYSLVLSGGYGEFLRSFYGAGTAKLVNRDRDSLFLRAWGNQAFGDERQRITSEEFNSRLKHRINNKIEYALDTGIPATSVMDYLYTSIRNRYFVGQISGLISRVTPRFDPLYSPIAAEVALRLSPEQREANILGFDLMDKMMPELADLPFDRDRVNDSFMKLRGVRRSLDFSEGKKLKFHSEPKPIKVPVRSDERISKDVILRANRLHASPRQVMLLPSVQRDLQEMISALGRSTIGEYLNYSVVHRLAHSELNHRVHIRRCHSLHALLLWYFNG